MPFSEPVPVSLDVGCGTGHSTEALSSVSQCTVGLDSSAAMLRQARDRKDCVWVQGSAEELPFASAEFTIVAVGLAFHWFDRIAFLRQAHRVLRPKTWLLIYNDYFCGTMHDNPAFIDWNKRYLERFPTPPRGSQPLSAEVFVGMGFVELGRERFSHSERYSFEQLTAYLRTQTNVMAALVDGRETSESISNWFRATLGPVFTTDTGIFEYATSASLYEKTA
jgi:SAM-dependent methyltransferase